MLLAIAVPQILGSLLGVLAVLIIFTVFLVLERKTRAGRDERPPVKNKVLRPPGYSLSVRLDDLFDSLFFAVLQSLGAGAIMGLFASPVYAIAVGLLLHRFTATELMGQPNAGVFLALFALFAGAIAWGARSIIRTCKLYRDIRHCRFGLRGEQAVAEALAQAAVIEADYVSFHDIPGDGKWNIDHVAIGPGGIFVIETKTRSKRKATRDQKEQDVWFDGQTLEFPWCEERDAVPQVERNAEWVRKFVASYVPDGLDVISVIVVPGWYVKHKAGEFTVQVMNATFLQGWLVRQTRRFSKRELKAVIARFDERCRNLEF